MKNIARFRRRTISGMSKVFKKRFLSMSSIVANSTPSNVAQITISESGTIVAAKIDILGIALSVNQADIQEVRLFLYCRPSGSTFLPDPTVSGPEVGSSSPQVDTINGFYVGSIFVSGQETTETQRLMPLPGISEKFRYRRKCDRNTEVILSAESIVRNGSAQNVNIVGAMYLTIQER